MNTVTDSQLLTELSADHVRSLSQQRVEPQWLTDLRLKAFDQYERLPWPGPRDEKWKRSEIAVLPWKELRIDASALPTLQEKDFSPSLRAALDDDSTEQRVVLDLQRGVNCFSKSAGAKWIPLSQAVKEHSERIKSAWSNAVDRAQANKFESLNLALATEGFCLFIDKNSRFEKAFRQYVVSARELSACFLMHFVFVDENSEVQLWEELVGQNSPGVKKSFISSYTSVNLAPNAKVSTYNLQHWDDSTIHFQFQDITQDKDSRLNTVAVSVGGRISRNETVIRLSGTGAENKVLGVMFGDEDQNFENWITQNHTAKKTTSDIQYRGALNGTAKAFFSGMVSITKEAQQSDAYQAAKYLLLSRTARADAIPNLEILADDVKCSHGAAVGPVDEDQKFYLATRGVPPEQAEHLIIQGFFEPVIANVPSEPTQERIRAFIEKKLRK